MFDFLKLSAQYQQALLRQVVPFWLKNSRDELCGGYFDILSSTGAIIESDKCVTQQARQVWAFAWLYNAFDGQPAWLEHARHGADFLSQFAHTNTFNTHAQLDRRGRAIAAADDVAPCSTIMAYAQMHRATADDTWAMLAKQLLAAWQEQQQERAQQEEVVGGLRRLKQLSEPVAQLKMMLEMQPFLDEESWKTLTDTVVQEILNEFADRRTDVLRECILPGGAFLNTPEGRRINVGLTFQTASFLLDFYTQSNSVRTGAGGRTTRKGINQIVSWCLTLCEQNWDETSGGLNLYGDFKQQPLIIPNWRQKWAWVQVEAMAALLKSYIYTHQTDCLNWFKRIHDYTFRHFPDEKQPGWHIAIDAAGLPLLSVKSLPETGCFSLVRCLTEIIQLLPNCESMQTRRHPERLGILQ